MNKPPETIYLQCYDEAGELLDLVHDDVTWCVDRINDRDAIYKLEPATDPQRIEELEAEVEWLQRELRDKQVRRDEWEKMYDQALQWPAPDALPCGHPRSARRFSIEKGIVICRQCHSEIYCEEEAG
jgi:hypothetical protein